jgi:two-component system nitrogen regulation response regulator GlnG
MSVLLVEDDPSIAIVITAALEAEGFAVARCDSISERDRLLGEASSALVTDVMLADGDGIETLDAVRRAHPALPLSSFRRRTRWIRRCAPRYRGFEYFPKPFDIDELVRTVRQAAGGSSAAAPGQDEGAPGQGLPLVGRSSAMQAVYRMITRVLRNDLTVLILGDRHRQGTGGRGDPPAGHRREGPFVAVNTAAIPQT